jgi:hypothetical protein
MPMKTQIATLLLLFAMPVAAQDAFQQLRKELGLDATVGVIESLENKRDPKCDATATRLENFMYGTPLAHTGREAKVDLQKKLIRTIWQEASDAARAAKADAVTPEILKPVIQRVAPYQIDEQKNAYVKLADGTELLLEERDVRQYGSVAYALRAILATQQDALLTPGVHLVALTPEAVQSMKEVVDVYTLAALNISDKSARKNGKKELDAALMTDAWKRVAPLPMQQAYTKPAEASKPGEVLRKIIAQKLVSFRTYNESADPLLYSNIQSFYARHPWPNDDDQTRQITRAFSGAVMNFIAETLVRAQAKAKAEGSPVVRERHIAAVYDEWAPYTVNIYEDVIFFANLPKEKQVYIEAYDADSLRDSGLHWHLIQQVIDNPTFPLELDLDPFAAELLAEGDAQIGVLTFRTAGELARREDSPTLQESHVVAAQKLIAQRFAEHLKAKPASKPDATKLASTSAKTRPMTGKFFDDVTATTGIEFTHRSSDWLSRFQRTFLYSRKGTDVPDPTKEPSHDVPPAFSGSGVAAGDIDNDGDADILLVGGLGNRVYLNGGDGTFVDGTAKSGLNWKGSDEKPGEPRQPLIVDLDNDGDEDVFISYVNAAHRVYRNNGDSTFTDVTATAKLGGEGLVGGPATAFDYDRDGLLDLYIGYYGNYLAGVGPNLSRVNTNGTPNRLYRNRGNFTFEDVSAGSGTENVGWTQAVAAVDFDLDAWPDLIVGNDFGVNAYYRNLGNGKFEDVAAKLGTDLPSSSMNIGTADLNKDGYPDVYISNIVAMVKDEKYVLPTEDTKMKRKAEKLATMRVVQNNHLFTSKRGDELHYAVNDAVDPSDTSTGWAWDADFFDFDNDGDDDLYLVNGLHEYLLYQSEFKVNTPNGQKEMKFAVHPREPNVFFVNEGGRLANRSGDSGADFSGNSRSAAYLDMEGDGDLDVVVNNFNDGAVFLRNNAQKLRHRWIKLDLVGDPAKGINADAIGARIVVTTPSGNAIWREVQSATGYLSQHPRQQHIGLGSESKADVLVYWPNGEKREYKGLEADKIHKLRP